MTTPQRTEKGRKDMKSSDRDLGMGMPIARRDFLNGALMSGAALSGLVSGTSARAADPMPYPPR
jgi:spermidine dehydrogenase